MQKAFTLLELMIVIIIVGVLATLGVTQYQAAIERARGAEARSAISQLRSTCAGSYIQDRSVAGCTNAALGIGTNSDQVPSACRATNFFSYGAVATGTNIITFTATRCTGTNGKQPGGSAALTLTLGTDYSAGADTWGGTGGY
jgi:prepilin-type N-terminal cleavage/methylation domain-containing protein